MRYFILLLIPYFLFSTPIKIATYNVENLFDASLQGSEYKEYIPGKHNWNKRMVEIKLNHTAEVICDLDADIVALQEIENKNIFKQLMQKLEKVGCAYSYGAISSKKGASIQVALLSRYPITKQHDIQVSYAPRVRNILEVDVDSIKRAVELGARYGLLITDSIHLSTMDKNRIGNIATNDGDFDSVDVVQAWKP